MKRALSIYKASQRPVVEARDWLSGCSLEGVDWPCRARWPSLICTRQVKATSRHWPTAPTLIGRLSSALSSTHWSKYTPLEATEEGCVSTFCSCEMMAYQQISHHMIDLSISKSLFLCCFFWKEGVHSYTAHECNVTLTQHWVKHVLSPVVIDKLFDIINYKGVASDKLECFISKQATYGNKPRCVWWHFEIQYTQLSMLQKIPPIIPLLLLFLVSHISCSKHST